MNKEAAYTAGAVIVGAIILYLLLHKAAPAGSPFNVELPAPPAPPAPINYVLNMPAVNQPQLPGQAACGCDGSNPLVVNPLTNLLGSLATQLAQVEQSYFAGILAGLPDWFAQNLNNVEGAYLSGNSTQTFLQL